MLECPFMREELKKQFGDIGNIQMKIFFKSNIDEYHVQVLKFAMEIRETKLAQ